ncbi:DNA/RNA non-specific endonuclease [Gloeobacter violaceus]|uniref:Endonuclease n=1 Tax=Gloeobacter violaceus (strain ATCC 29082 / PCC 7421) TaxID=251221 RepID=Q7NPI0_GLOVI|nr:DNA/RNA non-specific endonuclease [Gloeobacter violaceus]BAC88016.1 glr0075 [Gloeobacter violaceus PCC 7421]
MFRNIFLKRTGIVGAVLSALLLLAPKTSNAQTSSVHLTLGNPSGAVTSTSYSYNYLLIKSQYALSYSDYDKIPNWVSWQLNSSWLGSASRQNDFRPDSALPSGWYRVASDDYTNSGYDRGHMTPSADRTSSTQNNSATFLMTNILPQAPDNNQGPWAELEEYCRELVNQGKELYIIAGGDDNDNYFQSNYSGQYISVPSYVWKVIVVLDYPGQGVGGVNTNTRVIAVEMPNVQGIRDDDWRWYRVSVDHIEYYTGYNLLSNVSTSIQDVIEAQIDAG